MSGKITWFYDSPEKEQSCLPVCMYFFSLITSYYILCYDMQSGNRGRSREDVSDHFFISTVLFIWKFTVDRKYSYADFTDGETEAQTNYHELTSYLSHKWPTNTAPLQSINPVFLLAFSPDAGAYIKSEMWKDFWSKKPCHFHEM